MRLIASIGSAVANIQRLAEHFESLAGEADCRPAAAERAETVHAMALQAAAHAASLPHTGQGVFAALRERASATTIGLWAVRAPFAAKGLLKARRYRWMPEPRGGIAKSWWTELAPECVAAEIDWLREHVYQAFGVRAPLGEEFPRRTITARERWRRDPPTRGERHDGQFMH